MGTGMKGRVHITEVEDADAADNSSSSSSSSNPLSRLKQGEPVEAVVLGPVATQQVRNGSPTHMQAVTAMEVQHDSCCQTELIGCHGTCQSLYMQTWLLSTPNSEFDIVSISALPFDGDDNNAVCTFI